MKLVLANVDYAGHTSNEGEQFQRGLEHAGWTLVGAGFEDGCRDVPTLLQRHKPRAILVHDKRDWSPDCSGAFRKDIGYTNLEVLRGEHGIFRTCVVKDAGSLRPYHQRFCEEIGANAVTVYYHPDVVRQLNPWLGKTPLIRTYHSVDAEMCRAIDLTRPRARAVVTGATSAVYPVRMAVMRHAMATGQKEITVVGHPGYHNRGSHTPEYLKMLAGYRVHVATASMYGFALRKIVESVAMGCTPVTNLPEFDRLPEIDGALLRVTANAGVSEVLDTVAQADREWNLGERLEWARRAWDYYDWRASGLRLSAALAEAAA